MQPRQSLVDIFSTFIRFESDTFNGWITDSTLRRSMQKCLQAGGKESSETFWALYWHKLWCTQESDLAMAHVTAYLQEVCYWVSRKMSLNLAGRLSPADLFQTAIARIQSVLKGFNPQLSSNLKSYAEFTFGNIIKDTLRKNQEADICTDWALLQKVSQKRFVNALSQAGIDQPRLAIYVLAWTCFKALYMGTEVRNTRKLLKPELATWQAIAAAYNAERLSQLGANAPVGRPELLEQWLLEAAKAIRAFLYPNPVSIDSPIAADETTSLVERLPGGESDSLLTDLVLQEELESRQDRMKQLSSVLLRAIAQLDVQTQQLLDAYYGQALTQQQIAQQLEIQQYTVSRRLTSTRKTLLKQLAQWSQDVLHIAITADVLNTMSTVVDEWLSAHYRRPESSSV